MLHEMTVLIYSSGVEEWSCPTCGRRFLVEWSPAYNMIIIEPGDQYARHRGSQVDEATVVSYVEDEALLTEDSRLTSWETWMENIDLNEL